MSEDRKGDHIDLAFQAQLKAAQIDPRFYYEPMLTSNDISDVDISVELLGHSFKAPLWVSSMTGGTEKARIINHNLARICKEFGFGMGLGSCRPLLEGDQAFPDFNIRPLIGADLPLFANLGVAQIEELQQANQLDQIRVMVEKLQATGLIIHVNPMQEWLQPEGDIYQSAPIDIIKWCLDAFDFPIIVKEVGQGFGPESLKALLDLPIQALDFGANGGTNFALLEMLRGSEAHFDAFNQLANIGHGASEMVDLLNQIVRSENTTFACREIIISGGVKNFLDGYYLVQKSMLPAVYGQASGFLKYALDYEMLWQHVDKQIAGYKIASKTLRVKAG